ncbi:MAG TPA: response regulator [Tepidisphaeraceae bacterium]|nr:response regulator [Tepidisphaeraceae bacterium]
MTAQNPGGVGERRILIVEDDTLVGMGLRAQLEKLGHKVIGQAASAAEAKELFRDEKPDVVLMDIRLDGVDGISLAAELLAQRRVPMVIITAYGDKELIQRAGLSGVFGYLIKPVTAEGLQAQIEIAVRRFESQEQLIREKDSLAQTLETRKLVEKAKGIFMKRMNLDEAEAHKRLQQESQKRRISIAELAKRVIESEELLGSG